MRGPGSIRVCAPRLLKLTPDVFGKSVGDDEGESLVPTPLRKERSGRLGEGPRPARGHRQWDCGSVDSQAAVSAARSHLDSWNLSQNRLGLGRDCLVELDNDRSHLSLPAIFQRKVNISTE